VSAGAPGVVAGVAVRLFEAVPAPTAFVALTVNVYVVPLVRPLIVQPRVPVLQVAPPGEAIAV